MKPDKLSAKKPSTVSNPEVVEAAERTGPRVSCDKCAQLPDPEPVYDDDQIKHNLQQIPTNVRQDIIKELQKSNFQIPDANIIAYVKLLLRHN